MWRRGFKPASTGDVGSYCGFGGCAGGGTAFGCGPGISCAGAATALGACRPRPSPFGDLRQREDGLLTHFREGSLIAAVSASMAESSPIWLSAKAAC